MIKPTLVHGDLSSNYQAVINQRGPPLLRRLMSYKITIRMMNEKSFLFVASFIRNLHFKHFHFMCFITKCNNQDKK